MSEPDDFTVELRRVVDRLRSMPVTRLPQAHEPTRAVILALAGEPVPEIADHGLGDQLQVVATEAARARDFDRAGAAALLAALRRDLP